MKIIQFIQPVLALILAPLLFGIINRVKAKFSGRKGQPLLQTYLDLWKLLHKGAVYSSTTSWIFRAAPIISLAAIISIILIIPLGHSGSLIAFDGDFIIAVYLMAVIRFFIVIGALDTGSSFEGMGASREVQFSALAEPALLIGLAAVANQLRSLSFSGIFSNVSYDLWFANCAIILLVSAAFIIVLLVENSRIPFDDPNTHLELTMIHEVMVLDNSGPDLAMITYTSTLKLWTIGCIIVGILMPLVFKNVWLDILASVVALLALAVFIGIIESCMARFRLLKVPQLLISASAFSLLALIFVLRK